MVKYAIIRVIYQSLGPPDPIHPHLVLVSQNKISFFICVLPFVFSGGPWQGGEAPPLSDLGQWHKMAQRANYPPWVTELDQAAVFREIFLRTGKLHALWWEWLDLHFTNQYSWWSNLKCFLERFSYFQFMAPCWILVGFGNQRRGEANIACI